MKKRKLTVLEGVLINKSGSLGHRLRSKSSVPLAPKRRGKRQSSDDAAR